MADHATRRDSLIKTTGTDYIKTYVTYDGSNNPEFIYEAATNAKHGEKCLVTRYVYNGANQIEKSKESEAIWDSSWDI